MSDPKMIAKGSFGKFCGDWMNRILNADVKPALCHFTKAETMLKIVETGLLRATCVSKLNDCAEVLYATSVLRGYLERAWALESDASAADLFDESRRLVRGYDMSSIFVSSFSELGDEPGMWGMYAQRGTGFSFAVPTAELARLAIDQSCIFARVIYSPDELDEFCKSAIKEMRDNFLKLVAAGVNPVPRQFAEMYLSDLRFFMIMFKPRVWESEREWRMVYIKQPDALPKSENGDSYFVQPFKPALPIRAICAGPNCSKENSIRPLLAALSQSRYKGVFVHQAAASLPYGQNQLMMQTEA